MWQDIHGHDTVVEQFRRTLESGRLAATYLFVGPEGVGKRTFALRLAQALLCTARDPAKLAPCGACDSCLQALVGSHPDLDVVGLRPDKRQLAISQFVGDDPTRNGEALCHKIALRPMIGRRRVAIIDDADGLNVESANCLLKTLEEPPPGAVIILIGTSRSRQLPTILSRSQVVRFQPLPRDVVRSLVLAAGLAADEVTAAKLAERSEGSMARAADLADDAMFELCDRLLAAWHAASFDVPRLAREIGALIDSAGTKADARRGRFHQVLALAAERFRTVLRQAPAAGPSSRIALIALDRCLTAAEYIDRNANQATLIEWWLNELAALQPTLARPA